VRISVGKASANALRSESFREDIRGRRQQKPPKAVETKDDMGF
jgi:hypothetical protein